MIESVPISEIGIASKRDDRGAPALQEQDHDDDREDHRLDERLLHGVHGVARERDGVVDDLVGDAGRKRLLELLHRLADVVPRLERVGVRRLLHGEGDGGLEALVRVDCVVLRAELHARHVSDPRDAALRVALDDGVRELFGCLEAALRANAELIGGGIVVERRCADGAARHLEIVVA
jgi:hypothetical protein